MEMMTLKEYAADRQVTYEAVRRLVSKYRKQLEGHIIREKGTQYLDSEAIAFLNDKRRASRLVVIREENTDKIEALESEVETLTQKLIAAQNEFLQSQKKIIEIQDTLQKAIESNAKYNALIEDHERTLHDLDNTKKELGRSQTELAQVRDQLRLTEIDKEIAQREAGSYHKSIFGFYRKSN